jgi:hypothetical protein
MAFTIEVDDREWDVENTTRALVLPAQRGYVAELTTDEPAHGQITFHGDVALIALRAGDRLEVCAHAEDGPYGNTWVVDIADIRRISFY